MKEGLVTENDIKDLIITTLKLEDISPDDIAAKDPLFNEGLGLDSIDALELGIAISKKYGVKINESSKSKENHFSSIEALTLFINSEIG